MTVNSRRKGARRERQLRDEIRAAGWDARRGQQYAGSPDSPDVVHGLPWPFHLECKGTERLNVWGAMHQAQDDAGEGRVPLVCRKRSNHDWLATLTLADLLDLVREVGTDG